MVISLITTGLPTWAASRRTPGSRVLKGTRVTPTWRVQSLATDTHCTRQLCHVRLRLIGSRGTGNVTGTSLGAKGAGSMFSCPHATLQRAQASVAKTGLGMCVSCKETCVGFIFHVNHQAPRRFVFNAGMPVYLLLVLLSTSCITQLFIKKKHFFLY